MGVPKVKKQKIENKNIDDTTSSSEDEVVTHKGNIKKNEIKKESKQVKSLFDSSSEEEHKDNQVKEINKKFIKNKQLKSNLKQDEESDSENQQNNGSHNSKNVEEEEIDTDELLTEGEENSKDNDEDSTEEDIPKPNFEELLNDNDDYVENLEIFYKQTQRALIENNEIKKLEGYTRNLQTKIFNINTEDDYSEDDKLQMPQKGILYDGIPFHHRKNYPLEKHHIRRLYAHGIIYKTNQFSKNEDFQILKNWINYAKRYNIDFEDAPLYMGWVKSIDKSLTNQIKKHVSDPEFHGYMCLKLIDRSAVQVRRRCYRLFNPAEDNWKKLIIKNKFTEEEDEKLLHLQNLYGNQWQKIAVVLKKNRFDCHKRYLHLTENNQIDNSKVKRNTLLREFTPELVKDLYNKLKDYMEIHPVQLIVGDDIEEISRVEDTVDWFKLSSELKVFPDQCIEKWKEIKNMIRNVYEKLNDPEATVSKIEKEVFPPSYNEPKVRKMRAEDLQKSFEILYELAKEKQITELFEIDVKELTKRLNDAGLVFNTVYTLGSRILRIANTILISMRNAKILQTLPKSMTMIDLIELLLFITTKSGVVKKLVMTKKYLLRMIKQYLDTKNLEIHPNYIILYNEALEDSEPVEDQQNKAEQKGKVKIHEKNKVESQKQEANEVETDDES